MARPPKDSPPTEADDPRDPDTEEGGDDPFAELDEVLGADREVQHSSERVLELRVADPHARRGGSRRMAPPRGPLAVFGDGDSAHERWRVQKDDPNTGRRVQVGDLPASATEREFVKKFLRHIPDDETEDPVTFFLTPMDNLGRPMTPDPYVSFSFDALNHEVVKLREDDGGGGGGGGGLFGGGGRGGGADDGLLALLRSQLEGERAARLAAEQRVEAERARLEEERLDLLNRREQASTSIGTDLSDAYRGIAAAQRTVTEESTRATTTAMGEVLRAQREAAEQDRARAREEREEERRRAAAERQTEMERVRAESAERIRAAELANALRIAEIQAETARLDREAQRRADEAAERRREEMELRKDLTAERARLEDKAEQRRLEEARAERERAAQRERERDAHFTAMMTLIRGEKGENKPLGVIGDALGAFGLDIKDAIELGKSFIAGGEGKGTLVALIEGLTKLGEKAIDKFGGEEEEEEEEGGEEEEEEEEEEVRPSPKRRAPRQLPDNQAARDIALHPFSREVAEGDRVPVPVENPAAGAQGEPAPSPQAEPPIDLPREEVVAGRDAVLALVERLSDLPVSDWGGAVTELGADGPLLDYLGKVGVHRALRDAGAPEMARDLASILRNLGLLKG